MASANMMESDESHFFKIANLVPNLTGIAVQGLVVAKQTPRHVPMKNQPGFDRFVFSFTIRDSVDDIINAQCWGAKSYVEKLDIITEIHDVVVIQNPQIRVKGLAEEKFQPPSGSPFSLSISELYSKVIRHPNPPPEFLNLIPLPMPYALQGIVTLGDILLDTQSMVNQEISLTVLVKQVGRPRKFSGKDGQEKSVLEVIVCDDSCLNFPLKLWELSLIKLAEQWQPLKTVLFLADVRVNMDNFRGTPCLSPGFHSIVTVDPDPVVVPRAAALLRWVKTVDIDIINADDQEYLNVNEIKEIYTLTQLRTSLEIAKHQTSSAEASAGTKPPTLRGVLFATLVDFPIESHNGNGIVRKRCSSCQAGMAFDSSTCPKCESDTSSLYFALSVGLADCQGSLHGLQLKHTATQNLLGWTPEQFLKLSPEERSDCKHSFHLQHVKAIFNVCHVQQGPRLSILQMELADPVDMLRILE